MGKINMMNSNNTNITSINSNGSTITTRSSKALIKTIDSNNNSTIIRNSINNKVLVVEVNQSLSKSKNKANANEEIRVENEEGREEFISLSTSKSNADGSVVISSSLPSSPSSSASASSSSLTSTQSSLSIKDAFCQQQSEVNTRVTTLNNNENESSMNNQENENVKTSEVKTSSNNQSEKIENDLLSQSQSEITLQNSPNKSISLALTSGDIGKKSGSVNSQPLSPYLSANILLNGPNVNAVKSNNSFHPQNLSNALASLNNSNENIYFMMQTPNELMCTHPSSPTSSSSFVQAFKASPLNSPTQTNKLFLSQHQLQSILSTQNNNVFPSITTIPHSPVITNTITLSNSLSSPNNTVKNSISSSSSSNTSINSGVKGVRDERRRANHNEVERRRRDNINKWIVELSKVIPDCSNDQSKHGQSKGGILEKTVQYLLDIKEENLRLVDHIKNLEKSKNDNEALRQQNEYLLKENEILRTGKCDELDIK